MKEQVEHLDLIKTWNPTFEVEKIQVATHSSKSNIELARQNKSVHTKYLEIIHNDFMLGDHRDGVSYFTKRSQWKWIRKDIKEKNGIFYSIELPEFKYQNLDNPKMVIIFSFLGTDSSNAGLRTFPVYFPDITAHIFKGTTIVRIMDFNLSHGSFYLNTINYPKYELNIQKTIKELISENHILPDNVVMLGSSKGGTGALYHGLLGNYKSLSIDPITNENYFVKNKNDWHFMLGSRELDFIPEINKLSNFGDKTAIVVGNSLVEETYQDILRLSTDTRIKVFDTKNPLAYMHSLVGPAAKIEMITLLNILLDNDLHSWLKNLE